MDICIFCGSPADSGEHLFSEWIIKHVEKQLPGKHGFHVEVMGEKSTLFAREIKIPCVCQQCNNEWMSGMETTAKKFMLPMLDGKNHVLTRQEQQNLAEWCQKTAMCQDSVQKHPRYFTQEERDTFKVNRTLPKNVKGWAARINRPNLDSRARDFTLIYPKNKALATTGNCCTIQCGQLVLQILNWRMVGPYADWTAELNSMNAAWDKLIVQFWPPVKAGVKWPPRTFMHKDNEGTASFSYFVERFHNISGHRLHEPREQSK